VKASIISIQLPDPKKPFEVMLILPAISVRSEESSRKGVLVEKRRAEA